MSVPSIDPNQNVMITIILNRDRHKTLGITMKDYADAIISGYQPVLSYEDAEYHFGANDEAMAAALNWAQANNLTVIESHKLKATVKVQATVEQHNQLFNVNLMHESNSENNTFYITSNVNYTLPAELSSHVVDILGFNQKPKFKNHHIINPNQINQKINPQSGSGGSYVTPDVVSAAYKFPSNNNGGCIGLLELTDPSGYIAGFDPADVSLSFNNSYFHGQEPTIVSIAVDNISLSNTSDAESMLDITVAGGAAPGAKIAYYVGPNSDSGFYDVIATAASDTVNKPSSLGISWGIWEEDASGTYEGAFQLAVTVGMHCCVATGDYGVYDVAQQNPVPYQVQYPASSPYVIASGGTSFYGNATSFNEAAWTGSGGGISEFFNIPDFQTNAIPPIMAQKSLNGTAHGSPFSFEYRAIPDMSGPADPATGYVIGYSGQLYTVGGTSAAAPLHAALMTCLTESLGQRFGLPHGIFYTNQTVFFDVTTGNNEDVGSAGNNGGPGYLATPGWDAVTGLGSPNGAAMLIILQGGGSPAGPIFGKGQAYPLSIVRITSLK